jgi:hypothetical protein
MLRKMTWDVTSPTKARCETCKGFFGLVRYRFAQKQFCSNHCLERYVAERQQPLYNFEQGIDHFQSR